MPAKTKKPKTPAAGRITTVLLYPADDDRLDRIRKRLERRDPTRKITLPDVVRYALAVTDAKMAAE